MADDDYRAYLKSRPAPQRVRRIHERANKARAAYDEERVQARAERAQASYDSRADEKPQPGMAPSPSQDSKDLDKMTDAIKSALAEMVGSMDALSDSILRRDRTQAIDVEITGRDENQNIATLRVKKTLVDLQ